MIDQSVWSMPLSELCALHLTHGAPDRRSVERVVPLVRQRLADLHALLADLATAGIPDAAFYPVDRANDARMYRAYLQWAHTQGV